MESKISGDRDTFVHYASMTNGSAAVASNGGHITWNAGSSWKGWGTDYLYYTALHEIEHTLGMVHTVAGDIPTFKENGYGNENTAEFSIISYDRYVNDNLYLSLRDLRPYDLAYQMRAPAMMFIALQITIPMLLTAVVIFGTVTVLIHLTLQKKNKVCMLI
ncbi:hypothetical protein QA330_09750 [Glaesserella parasuis]|nr:hypothetical protein [Glaesserella parasuis]